LEELNVLKKKYLVFGFIFKATGKVTAHALSLEMVM
jgi:hypothetical protein